MVVCGALVVPPSSAVYTPQDLAYRLVALDFGNGTAYAGLQMLEGAVPREAITTCSFDANPAKRYAALMAGEFDATVLQEPWITVAEKAGCRLISTTFFYGTWVADATMDGATYAAFVRASTEAVRRINADKRRYLHYFTREYVGYAEVEALTPDDFTLGRIQVQAPGPIPEADARWDWEWMSSWGVLHGTFDAAAQINTAVQQAAHAGRSH
jgi:ABC-type nitrate/sulfonate/bicarbonate transport system substrate-binding protein